MSSWGWGWGSAPGLQLRAAPQDNIQQMVASGGTDPQEGVDEVSSWLERCASSDSGAGIIATATADRITSDAQEAGSSCGLNSGILQLGCFCLKLGSDVLTLGHWRPCGTSKSLLFFFLISKMGMKMPTSHFLGG